MGLEGRTFIDREGGKEKRIRAVFYVNRLTQFPGKWFQKIGDVDQ
jgi:hypothetical protein